MNAIPRSIIANVTYCSGPPRAPDSVLFRQALLTGILNPKVAIFYLSLFPQFIDPARGSVLAQSLILGVLQLMLSIPIDAAWVLLSATIARWFANRTFEVKPAMNNAAFEEFLAPAMTDRIVECFDRAICESPLGKLPV